MLKYLFQDFKAHKMSNLEIFVRLFIDRGASAVFFYRLSSWCYGHKLRLFAILLKQLNIFINKSDIAYQSDIGVGLRIFHSIGIVMGICTIGKNFTIYQNATIGLNGKVKDNGQASPIIGDNVTFYTGSVVVGPIIIGDNVKVAANVVIVKDTPSNSTVIGQKPEIIHNKTISS